MKTKRFLAVLVTCVFAFVICAVPAMAEVIPSAPGEKARLMLETNNTDGTESKGDIQFTGSNIADAEKGMVTTGEYYELTAQAQTGYLFDSWTLSVSLRKADGTVQALGGADYADEAGQKAFEVTNEKVKVNFVEPKDAVDGDVLEYNITANFKKDPASVAVTVNYVYSGLYGADFIYTETQYLTEGTHTITADAAQYEGKGFQLVDAAANTQEVNVTQKDGQLVADVDTVSFSVKPTVDPTTVSFSVTYVDLAGNPIGAGGRIWFDDIGVYDRENILLPYGYRAIPPAHPGEDWFYPTSLEYIDGQWQATVPDLEIVVAKSVATVNIQFALEDGTLLPDLSYEKAYFNVGGGIETVEAPEGYEFVGENTYAVEVTEDDLLNLVVDPTEVTFTVKPVATTPGNPENPTDNGTTTPPQDGTMGGNPTTGDATPYVILAVTVAAAAGVMVVAFKRRKA